MCCQHPLTLMGKTWSYPGCRGKKKKPHQDEYIEIHSWFKSCRPKTKWHDRKCQSVLGNFSEWKIKHISQANMKKKKAAGFSLQQSLASTTVDGDHTSSSQVSASASVAGENARFVELAAGLIRQKAKLQKLKDRRTPVDVSIPLTIFLSPHIWVSSSQMCAKPGGTSQH